MANIGSSSPQSKIAAHKKNVPTTRNNRSRFIPTNLLNWLPRFIASNIQQIPRCHTNGIWISGGGDVGPEAALFSWGHPFESPRVTSAEFRLRTSHSSLVVGSTFRVVGFIDGGCASGQSVCSRRATVVIQGEQLWINVPLVARPTETAAFAIFDVAPTRIE